jgi:hypothetical protein
LRNGARALLAQAVEAEVAALLSCHADKLTNDGRQRLVRHGHLPEREIVTGIGPVAVRCPRVRDRVGEGSERIRFTTADKLCHASGWHAQPTTANSVSVFSIWLLNFSARQNPLTIQPTRHLICGNPRAAASRSWRASLIRKRAQVLGDVQAPSREAAEAAAVREFNLSDEQRSRLVVQERG